MSFSNMTKNFKTKVTLHIAIRLDKSALRLVILTVCIMASLSCVHATKLALLVGVSSYERHKTSLLNWRDIHGANDVAMIGKTLRKQGFIVTTLCDNKATAKNIRKAIDLLNRQASRGDLVYIHFSAHGQPFEDLNGDESDGWDESIVPYDAGKRYIANVYDGRCHIIDDELNAYVTKLRRKVWKTGFVYVVVDACHSGGSYRGEEDDSAIVRGTDDGFSRSGKLFIPTIDSRSVIRIANGKGLAGTCYLEACRSYQSNHEIKVGKTYYGAMSYYINEVLSAQKLTANTEWTEKVRKMMSNDRRLLRQNMVVERSSK